MFIEIEELRLEEVVRRILRMEPINSAVAPYNR